MLHVPRSLQLGVPGQSGVPQSAPVTARPEFQESHVCGGYININVFITFSESFQHVLECMFKLAEICNVSTLVGSKQS